MPLCNVPVRAGSDHTATDWSIMTFILDPAPLAYVIHEKVAYHHWDKENDTITFKFPHLPPIVMKGDGSSVMYDQLAAWMTGEELLTHKRMTLLCGHYITHYMKRIAISTSLSALELYMKRGRGHEDDGLKIVYYGGSEELVIKSLAHAIHPNIHKNPESYSNGDTQEEQEAKQNLLHPGGTDEPQSMDTDSHDGSTNGDAIDTPERKPGEHGGESGNP